MNLGFLYIAVLLLVVVVLAVLHPMDFKLYRRREGGHWYKVVKSNGPYWTKDRPDKEFYKDLREEEIYYGK